MSKPKSLPPKSLNVERKSDPPANGRLTCSESTVKGKPCKGRVIPGLPTCYLHTKVDTGNSLPPESSYYELLAIHNGQRIDRMALDRRLLTTEHSLALNQALVHRSAAAALDDEAVELIAQELAGWDIDAEGKSTPRDIKHGHLLLAAQKLANKALPASSAHASLVARINLGREKIMLYTEILAPFMDAFGRGFRDLLLRHVRLAGGDQAQQAKAMAELDRWLSEKFADASALLNLPRVLEAEDDIREGIEHG